MNKLYRFIKDPDYRFLVLAAKGFYNHMSDREYLLKTYRIRMGKELHIDDPVTYNEKIQWLKLYDRKQIYTTMVDKYEVKQYVSKIIGEQHVIPTIGVWNRFDDINFDELPNQFVLKCTHDSGGIVICKDKKNFDIKEARNKINRSLKTNYYWYGREWPYKDVRPRIIAEKYMQNKETEDLKDFKVFTFNGKAKALFVATDRQSVNEETKFDFYDIHFNHLPLKNGHPNSERKIDKPVTFDEMIQLAEKLSAGIPHLRVDFYEVDGEVYFGELTFSHWSGFVPFNPEKWDYIFGSWITLPSKDEVSKHF